MHYITLPIYPLHFQKFCPFQKQEKGYLSVSGKNDPAVYLIFYKLIFFWNFDHVSRTYNQVNYRNIWFAKVVIIFIRTGQALFCVFPKKTGNFRGHYLWSWAEWQNVFYTTKAYRFQSLSGSQDLRQIISVWLCYCSMDMINHPHNNKDKKTLNELNLQFW